MNNYLSRYSKITDKNPREIILLKSLPCIYGKCSFCNYILDNSTDTNEIYLTNIEVISQITGEFGVLEVINSASVFELPETTLSVIRKKVVDKQIKILYFEAFHGYINRLQDIRDYFAGCDVRFRIGLETFDDEFRNRIYNKPFRIDNIDELSKEFYSCLLLICVKGQTRRQILNDIEMSGKYFRETIINVFIENTTDVKRDGDLVSWFLNDVYPHIKEKKYIEILLDNKDFGVFVQ